MKEKSEYYYTLDILKFVLSLLIFVHHFQLISEVRFSAINFNDGRFYFGYLVELFFVISGFLSAKNKSKLAEMNLKEYFLPKLMRFYPMCWLSIICIIVLEIINKIIFGSPLSTDGMGIWKLINNFALTFDGSIYYAEGTLGFNNPLWYICVLLLCYLLFFFVVKTCDKKGFNIGLIGIFIVLFSYWLYIFNLSLIPPANRDLVRGIIPFFLGVTIEEFYLIIRNNRNIVNFKKYVSLLSLIIVLLSFIFAYDYLIDDQYSIFLFVVSPSVLFLTLCLNKKEINKKSENVCKLLGRLSFELYVWHSFFNKLYLTFLRSLAVDAQTLGLLLTVMMLIINIIAAVIFDKLDRKFLSINKKLIK